MFWRYDMLGYLSIFILGVIIGVVIMCLFQINKK
ncbi:MAG: DUF3789 domain-containing protein [[Clostridium] spiroforme]|nr:DUF3789 domain-containing protein [Thomasclavelia spiroformis]MBS6685711.1 DUF3789 domain-containing protein [Thomasclavelia spiroformis]MBS7217485.1 DUF3789 domain-containing protein [Thomasclavelia spiroformis]